MDYRENRTTERSMDELSSFASAYIPYGMLHFLCCIVLEGNVLHSITGSILISLWSYFYHRFVLHNIAHGSHMMIHHSPRRHISKVLDITFDAIEITFSTCILLFLQDLFGIHIITYSLAFMLTLYYISTHSINYSIIGSPFHQKHHTERDVNFFPDILDHAFGTNATTEFEDMSHMIPNILVSFLVTYCLFKL